MLRRLSIIAILAKINCHKVTGNYERGKSVSGLAVYGGIAGLSHRSGAEFMMKAEKFLSGVECKLQTILSGTRSPRSDLHVLAL